MRRSAQQTIRELEARIAKLEKTSSEDTEFYIEAIGDISRGLDSLSGLKADKKLLNVINKQDLDKVLSVERELNNLYKALG